jgi:hypothetical protein
MQKIMIDFSAITRLLDYNSGEIASSPYRLKEKIA